MRTGDLDQLVEIAKLVADRDLAALAELRAQAATLRDAARDLERPRAPAIDPGNLTPSVRAGAEPLWDRWRSVELRRIQMRRASVAVREADALKAARLSFGRHMALTELSRK